MILSQRLIRIPRIRSCDICCDSFGDHVNIDIILLLSLDLWDRELDQPQKTPDTFSIETSNTRLFFDSEGIRQTWELLNTELKNPVRIKHDTAGKSWSS